MSVLLGLLAGQFDFGSIGTTAGATPRVGTIGIVPDLHVVQSRSQPGPVLGNPRFDRGQGLAADVEGVATAAGTKQTTGPGRSAHGLDSWMPVFISALT